MSIRKLTFGIAKTLRCYWREGFNMIKSTVRTNVRKKRVGKAIPRAELKQINAGAAAIDIGATMHMVAINLDHCDDPVRAFGTFPHDLYDIAAWLKTCGVSSVAMEFTDVCWIPAYEVMKHNSFEVVLVNARYAKNMPHAY